MRDLQKILNSICPVDKDYLKQAKLKLDSLTKPRESLGRLEVIAQRYAAIKEDLNPSIDRKVIFTFAGDHGVVAEGVSAYPKEVTIQMVLNMLFGGAAINVLARHVGAKVVVVDIGVDHDFEPTDGLVINKTGYGTNNLFKGPAMTYDKALQSIKIGITLADEYAGRGVDIIGTGEMGIGNTTPASAILCVFTGLPAREATGRGTGINDRTFQKKIDVIERAIELNQPDPEDPVDVLAKVGGFEIGGIAGLIIGSAFHRIPVVDGFISTSGALIAARMNPAINEYLFFSHLSSEAGHKKMLENLGQKPILDLDMRLGEGTGAAIAMSIIEAAIKIMREMASFESAGVDEALVITAGAFHLDGFADTIDGLAGGTDREKVLAIMRDSQIGSFAVVGLILILMLKVFALMDVPAEIKNRTLLIMPVLGRWSTVQLASCFSYARSGPGVALAFTQFAGKKEFVISTFITTAILIGLFQLKGLWILLVTAALTSLFGLFFKRRIKGVTEDIMGAACELSEAAALLLICALFV
ncbi:MAG: nicotinate-nucleotide--dimethylbenzimidazole phosphoribosyltransferase [Deltaproteobacteria bacterium]|nr:nicotinate-nucleotide--dimethylbenzimidazole phosphoribosyltransferase [Deltaproteobacteria bacterium]